MRGYSLLISAALLMGALTANADSLVTIRPTGTDSVNWSQLGSSYTSIANPFTFTTADGVAGTGSYASGTGEVRQQNNGWAGNFADGDFLNWTTDVGNGPLTLNFSQGFTQIGAQIQSDYFGAFTAQICDVNGCVSEDGNSTSAGDDSAIYIGISSATPIDSVTFSLTSASYDPNDFAINQVSLDGGASPVPEPSSLLLFGSGLVGFAGAMRRKFARKA